MSRPTADDYERLGQFVDEHHAAKVREQTRTKHYTDRMSAVLARARTLADLLGHNYVGSEHVLMAMSEIDCCAGYVLKSLVPDCSFNKVAKEVGDFLGYDPKKILQGGGQ